MKIGNTAALILTLELAGIYFYLTNKYRSHNKIYRSNQYK